MLKCTDSYELDLCMAARVMEVDMDKEKSIFYSFQGNRNCKLFILMYLRELWFTMLIFFLAHSNFHKHSAMVGPKTVKSTGITKSCCNTLALLVYT